jgi:porin
MLFDNRIELRLGRFPPTDDFLVSTYNFGFMSNAFCGNPFGILLDASGATAYTGTWAALVKVRPTNRTYVMAAVYNGDPAPRANKYHGVNLSLNGPAFAMAEVGYQINGLPGDSPLLGNYKLGAWYDDSTPTEFKTGAKIRGNWGFYRLFDRIRLTNYTVDSLVSVHRGFDHLRSGRRRTGSNSGATNTSMLRATPGCRRISPIRSSVSTIW